MKMDEIIKELSSIRPIFNSEDDFKFSLALAIKEKYPKADIRLEFCPRYYKNIYIDILVIKDNKWIPIELKYKTKKLKQDRIIGDEIYSLVDHSAKDQGCCRYLKDISRIENLIKESKKYSEYKDKIEEGYTIFITNDHSFTKAPQLRNGICYYKEFSLEQNRKIPRKMNWIKDKNGPSEGTMGEFKNGIELICDYEINWKSYSNKDILYNDSEFIYLMNKIEANKIIK